MNKDDGHAFHFCQVWGSRHGGSYYSEALVEELIKMGWKVTVLAEEFSDTNGALGQETHKMESAGPCRPRPATLIGIGNQANRVERVRLSAFFKRTLFGWWRKLAELSKVWTLVTSAPGALVIVQGDLPRIIYLLLQVRVPLLFIRQDAILTCPGNTRFLRRTRSVCLRRLGVSCLRVHAREGCLGTLSPAQQLGRLVFRIRDRLLLSRIRNFVANSQYIARVHSQPERVLYPPSLPGTAQPVDAKRDLHRLIFCGRLEEVKGARDALGILSLLPEVYQLEVLGEGPERGRLGKFVQELELRSRVRFHGWVDRLTRDQLLASAGALLMPSLWDEAFGMAGIEALAQGTPVVGYAVGGIAEWCSDGCGVLVPCGDIRRAAAAVRELTDDPARWARSSEMARRVATLRFPPSRFASDLRDLLRGVLEPATAFPLGTQASGRRVLNEPARVTLAREAPALPGAAKRATKDDACTFLPEF